MREEARQQALDAVNALDQQAQRDVLGWLCAARPEAVLAAVDAHLRHNQVLADLLRQRPPS